MKHPMRHLPWLGLTLLNFVPIAQAQSVIPLRTEEAFASENAIVDTSIPFAIGANEARQSLRGAFGWPTFQEGLVEGVYFRFDPDGYARFSPNPRLDVDVFEVVCKARTNECLARKGGLSVLLLASGQLQLKLDDALQGDTFFLSEGISEIQVPERILMPMDVQLETLLGTATELILRRGGEEVSRLSLRGFVATTAYLRWIKNRQDYSVLPRNWPVPNARNPEQQQRLTESSGWSSPMPRPQVLAPGQTILTIAPPATPVGTTVNGVQDRSFAEIEADLKAVKEILAQLSSAPPSEGEMVDSAGVETEMTQLQAFVTQLAAELGRLSENGQPESQANETVPPEGDLVADLDLPLTSGAGQNAVDTTSPATHLRYLIEDLGLDMRTAVAVLEVASNGAGLPEVADDISDSATIMADPTVPSQLAERDKLVEELLSELDGQLAVADMGKGIEAEPVAPEPEPTLQVISVPEYQLLSYYFRSAGLPLIQEAR